MANIESTIVINTNQSGKNLDDLIGKMTKLNSQVNNLNKSNINVSATDCLGSQIN